MKDFIAHLHPLLVHLPIGILLLAAVFAWMGRKEQHASLLAALPILLRIGAAAALISCYSGWLLGGTGAYDPDTLQLHQWLGIATTAVATLACFTSKKLVFITLAAVLLIATGHFGGSMTHGEGFLTEAFQAEAGKFSRPSDVQEAPVYAGVIAGIFQEKCTSCHGSGRQKGGLRLDNAELIQKGGKGGTMLLRNSAGESELLRRCLLPLGHEDHMPPKDKAQLSTIELEILRWWLTEGADFQKKTKDLPQTDMIRNALAQWQQGGIESALVLPDVPEQEPSAASTQVLDKLRQFGVLVLRVGQKSNWLSLSFVNAQQPSDSVFVLLEKIAPQAVWLNMSGCNLPESAWNVIGNLKNLTRLSLDNSSVSDTTIAALKNLQNLQYLNLSQTLVSGNGLGSLAGLSHLSKVFLYKTALQPHEWASTKALFPKTSLDTGGYVLPFLVTDTARLEAAKSY